MENETGIPISFNDMNASFLERFTGYYAQKGYSPTTIRKAVNLLVWFLNWATDHGYNMHREYRKFYRKLEPLKAAPQQVIFLQWQEVMTIRHFRCEGRKWTRARDLFCFMSFTGIRYSELCRLKKEDVGAEEITVKGNTGKIRKLPLNSHASEIWQVYENKYYLENTAFPVMSIITLNKHLREIGKRAGLERKVRPAIVGDPDVPLYERLTAGVAVNTFIAHALQLDVAPAIISGFTGVQHDSRLQRIRAELARKAMDKY
jgi:site-specific recombinase XerD